MKKLLVIIFVLGLSISACDNPTDVEDKYHKENLGLNLDLPLDVGNKWSYRLISYDVNENKNPLDSILTAEITNVHEVDGIKKYAYNAFGGFGHNKFNCFVYNKDDGMYMSKILDGKNKFEAKIIDSNIEVGDVYNGYLANYLYGLFTDYKDKPIPDLRFGEIEVISIDTNITVEAGTFNCVHIRWQWTPWNKRIICDDFYSQEVGRVLFEESILSDDKLSQRKSWGEELVEYVVKK
jgi:hypothetical protein